MTRNSSLVIGQSYGGVVVAYIADPGEPASEQHGLIAATADQSAAIPWALGAGQTTLVPGGTGTDIGTGSANTTRIILQNGAGSAYAAGLARAYTDGTYHDWYLPSKDELNELFLNKTAIGDFESTMYWSSSEADAEARGARHQEFANGLQTYEWKSREYRVRPVRSFPADSAKAISAFTFPTSTGTTIDQSAKTIAVTVPYDTVVTGLVASFTTSAAVVAVGSTPQTSGTTANNFTTSVIYTVTAADASTQDYVVTVTAPLVIGDAYGGGKVAYVLQPDDPGYSASVQKGLIAATTDQSPGIQWAIPAYQSAFVSGTGFALGTGSANTTRIILQNGAGSTYAAGLARAYNGGDYDDWYLPSKDELDTLYDNKTAIGDLEPAIYWSSSEDEYYVNDAWLQVFGVGLQVSNPKGSTYRVRAVRSFPANSDKAISAFSFQGLSPAVTGVVNESAQTIAVTVPYDTVVTGLVASFTTSGAVVAVGSTPQTSGTTANDFSSDPVTYTVTAADASTQTYSVTVTVAPLAIGDAYQGGVVAYILQPTDLGYTYSTDGITRGLIAAAADQTPVDPASGIIWAVVPNQNREGGTGTALGTGSANTTAIIAQNGPYVAGTNAYAAGLARAYNGGGYDDWYLPSRWELWELYRSKAAIGGFDTTTYPYYWSSTEGYDLVGHAWYQGFGGGDQHNNFKFDTNRVRAVRAF